ncbi:hypothetical protein KC340_g1403 [Hortaea werneckii]|nr:hypothetical protein KC342_g1091 [Hortaea werneckii]KAI7107076.1 hypothetical protein KC339_g2627 [Hortaea werneckii]KAI7243600.1 hypothetical protein KC365_g2165 [Hortaea werneckii]KAI7336978.1 hypothetical protein KC340_g1403 [Hortaea werneckii]KAI7387498.1 hypothetical protein KC328_g9399 [Hortaea werneckii]
MAYVYALANGWTSRESGYQTYYLSPSEAEMPPRPATPPPPPKWTPGTVLEAPLEPPARPCTPEPIPLSPGHRAITQRRRQKDGSLVGGSRGKGPQAGKRPSKAIQGKRKREEVPLASAVEEDAEMEGDVEMVEAGEEATEAEEKEEVEAGKENVGPKKKARLNFD